MKNPHDLETEIGVSLRVLRRLAAAPDGHYFYRRIRTRNKMRTLRVPRGNMLTVQRAINEKILRPMPLSAEIHGWRRRKSPRTYAMPHLRQSFVLNVDISDFFPSVGAGRVYAFWRQAGYGEEAARLLTLLTTIDNQLPQGAPTSPALGNQILLPLHRRLSELARQHGLRYGSYGDEVCISGRRRVKRLKGLVLRIVEQEGFAANPRKIKEMPREGHQELAGVVVNKKIGPGRDKYRALRALLHNCVKNGPESQNRQKHHHFKQHLRGKIAQVQGLNPKLGRRLMDQFDKIRWPDGAPSTMARHR